MHALRDRVAAERRSDRALSGILTGAGSAPARSTIARSFDELMSKLPVMRALPPGCDPDVRSGLDDAVENDGKLTADVGARDAREVGAALRRHVHADAPRAGLVRVEADRGVRSEPSRSSSASRFEHGERAGVHAADVAGALSPRAPGVSGGRMLSRFVEASFDDRRPRSPGTRLVEHAAGDRVEAERGVGFAALFAAKYASRRSRPPSSPRRHAPANSRSAVLPMSSIARPRSVRPGSCNRDAVPAFALDERLGDAELVHLDCG